MSDLFVLLFLVSIGCLFYFVIRPKFRKKKFILSAVLSVFISFLLVGVFAPPNEKATLEKNAKTTQVEKDKADQKAKKELAAQEKAEAEKKAKEELAAQEKAEAEQKAKEELAAKVEAEQKAKEELIAQEKAEAEQKAKDELAAQEQAEAEQIAQEQAEAEQRAKELPVTRVNQANQAAETAEQGVEVSVYIAPQSGTKYHYDSSCRGLSSANSIQSIALSDATSQGYGLCGFED